MLKFLKDFVSPLVCILTLVAGMAYSSGIQSEKIKTLEAVSIELKGSMKELEHAVTLLQETVAAQTQQLKDKEK